MGRKTPARVIGPSAGQKPDGARVLPGESVQQECGIGDRSGEPCRLGPDRQAVPGGKGQIACDFQPERQIDSLDLAQREDAEFGRSETEVRQPVVC